MATHVADPVVRGGEAGEELEHEHDRQAELDDHVLEGIGLVATSDTYPTTTKAIERAAMIELPRDLVIDEEAVVAVS